MEPTAPDFRLLEPSAPESLLPASGFPLGLALAGAAALLVAGLALFLLKKKRAAAEPSKHREEAFSKARDALLRIQASHARDAAVQASLILRGFLAGAVNDPALFETHEEFVAKRDSLQALSAPAREAGEQGFLRLARLKYAPGVEGDPQAVIADAGELLETFHRGLPA